MEKPQKGTLEAKLFEDFHGFELQIDEKFKNKKLTVSTKAQIYLTDKVSADQFLRVQVVGGGCSGLSYGFSLEDKTDFDTEKDIICFDSPMVVTDEESQVYLPGAELILEESIIGNRLNVNNPGAVQSCGCGESFSVKYK